MNFVIKIFLMGFVASCWAFMSFYFFGKLQPGTGFFQKDSWKRKYRIREGSLIQAKSNWYTKTFKLKYKERFPLSATALVFLTDAYHLAQWIMTKALIAMITIDPTEFFVLWVCWLLGFNIMYLSMKQ